jgi:hypothetical protein
MARLSVPCRALMMCKRSRVRRPGAQSRLPGVAAAIARRSARSATARGGQASRPNAAERTVVLAERSEHGPVVLGVRGERGRGPGRAARRPGRARAARIPRAAPAPGRPRGLAVELPVLGPARARPPGLARSRVPLAVEVAVEVGSDAGGRFVVTGTGCR